MEKGILSEEILSLLQHKWKLTVLVKIHSFPTLRKKNGAKTAPPLTLTLRWPVSTYGVPVLEDGAVFFLNMIIKE